VAALAGGFLMGNELDAMMWRIVNGIPAWPSYDLF
jgi:hypothetical protein